MIWFGLIKLALAVGFSAPEGSSAIRRALVYCFTVNGEGLDPSYFTFFVPLFAVPIISLLTRPTPTTSTEDESRKADFYAMLSGEKKVDAELV